MAELQMPELEGYGAAREIRSLSHTNAKRIPIIAMTANVFCEDVAKCLAAGMNAHLGKPLEIKELISAIRKYAI